MSALAAIRSTPAYSAALAIERAAFSRDLSPIGERFAARASRRAAAGLVSESTSGFALLKSLPTVMAWAEAAITIDRLQARVTRMRKSVGVASKCFINLGDRAPTNNVMSTLTVRDGYQWKPRDVSDYLRCVRMWFKDRCPGQKLRYVWVAEIQDGKRREDGVGRGAIHYHVIFFLPEGVRMPHADRMGWWPHGMTNTKYSTSPIAYLVSYAKKVDSKNVGGFPRGARISGFGGLDNVGRAIRRWCLLPAYVQANASITDRFKPAAGGGYRNDATGEVLLAEFAPTGGGFTSFVRIRTNPRPCLAELAGPPDGPWSWLPESSTVH